MGQNAFSRFGYSLLSNRLLKSMLYFPHERKLDNITLYTHNKALQQTTNIKL